ncbi:MAG TPA: hypothetical protein VG326_04470 [Tepidisphaeraceae bacterium]|jgi:cytochrome c556|nr:hypothetical protein [Tepidisphaeraceae bacterium]
MKRSHFRIVSIAVASGISAAAFIGLGAVSRGDDTGSTPTIKEIMKVGFAGDKKAKVDSLTKVVTSGKGTHENADQLLKLCKELADRKPPKGDTADWTKRTGDLVAAAEQLDKGDMPTPESIAAYKKAADCKSCHTEFRPPKK